MWPSPFFRLSICYALRLMLPIFQPLPVIPKQRPFDGSEWLFELKYDGFRALAYIEHGRCRFVSRNGHEFSSFVSLASSLARIPHDGGVILDGEITCVDTKGRPRFNDLLFRRREPCFFAFDLLYLTGNDCVAGTRSRNGSLPPPRLGR